MLYSSQNINVEDIKKLFLSSLSTYRIAKEAKIPQSSVTGYRNKKLKLSNMTLNKALKLQALYDKLLANSSKNLNKRRIQVKE